MEEQTDNTKLQAVLGSSPSSAQCLCLGDHGQAPKIPRAFIFHLRKESNEKCLKCLVH